ncbi:MAG: glycosyltransferase family 4 protein [Actinomycetota bacterium]
MRPHGTGEPVDELQQACPRVLRIYHSGVVGAWRERDRVLAAAGAQMSLACATEWNEGGRAVRAERVPGDPELYPVRTLGRHPNLFAYHPIALWRALRARPIDVLDIHEEPVSVAAAEVQALAWLAGYRGPFCLYSAQNIEKRYPPPFRWMERIALRRASAVHVCNDAAGEILRRKGFQGAIVNLGLGVDTEHFAPEGEPGDVPSGGGARIGYVGRIEIRKGVLVLAGAIAQTPDVTLEVIGDGPDRSALDAEIDRLGIADRVTVTGFVAHDDLPARYCSFDLVVVPSLETPRWIEQFGRVAVEAMACGVPVVASDSGSLPEVVGDAGVLVPPGDVVALSNALKELVADPGKRLHLGRAALRRAAHWSWGAIAERQFALYCGMLDDAT